MPYFCGSLRRDVLNILIFKPHFQEALLIAPDTPRLILEPFFLTPLLSLAHLGTYHTTPQWAHLPVPHETLSPLRAKTHSFGSVGTQRATWHLVGLRSCRVRILK